MVILRRYHSRSLLAGFEGNCWLATARMIPNRTKKLKSLKIEHQKSLPGVGNLSKISMIWPWKRFQLAITSNTNQCSEYWSKSGILDPWQVGRVVRAKLRIGNDYAPEEEEELKEKKRKSWRRRRGRVEGEERLDWETSRWWWSFFFNRKWGLSEDYQWSFDTFYQLSTTFWPELKASFPSIQNPIMSTSCRTGWRWDWIPSKCIETVTDASCCWSSLNHEAIATN